MHKEISIYDRFRPGIVGPDVLKTPAYWFAFRGEKLLVGEGEDHARIPQLISLDELGLAAVRHQYLGDYGKTPCFSAELQVETTAPEGMAFHGLRNLFEALEEDFILLAGRAKQIMEWDRDHQFCGRCATPTETQWVDRSKKCPNCKLISFPRLAPAIIVAVRRGDELLLAQSTRFVAGWYSVLAGFVEPGETLEEAVRREVLEEVGIQLKNIRYFGNQPWPFPHSLMVGFTAEYAGGELKLDETEIKDAQWFTVENLPRIPSRVSIARHLIDAFIESV